MVSPCYPPHPPTNTYTPHNAAPLRPCSSPTPQRSHSRRPSPSRRSSSLSTASSEYTSVVGFFQGACAHTVSVVIGAHSAAAGFLCSACCTIRMQCWCTCLTRKCRVCVFALAQAACCVSRPPARQAPDAYAAWLSRVLVQLEVS